MTFAYGSKKFGMSRQLQESLLDEAHPDLPAFCSYLAVQIWTALESTVVAAFSAMEWLSKCAEAVVPVAKTVEWTVPITGFPVRQEYWNIQKHQVTTTLCGKAVRLNTFRETKEPLLHKHKNSIAPNYIHSLDAAALMMTVVRASAEGVTSFGMVHDCYATHACDVPKLATATREAFVQLYDGQDVADQFHAQLSEVAEIPPPPPQGTLDLQVVLDSAYFFS